MTSKLKSFLFFLLLSIIFWTLTKFSKESNNIIPTSIVYTNIPESSSITDSSVNELSFGAFINGFQSLSYKFNNPTLTIDVSKYYETGDTLIFISDLEISKMINSQIDDKLKVESLSVEELVIGLDAMLSKKVPIQLKTDVSYKEGFWSLGNFIVTPDSVTVFGPSEIINTITEITTEELVAKNVSEKIENQLNLKVPEKIFVSQEQVEVKVNVDEFTQKKVIVPIILQNVPEDTAFKLLPEKLELTFNVSVHQFNDITANDFMVACDITSLTNGVNFMVPKVIKQPENIHQLELATKKIEYLIFK
ncbi:MAG: hypothetical protein K0U54_10305 [Bacteroidetes bacterium]|nr:hypothetical protein [Bacteroidota bacterium]